VSDRRRSVARHGLAYRFNGFPIYETDAWSGESVIVGVVYEPRWNEADLTKRQRAEFDAFVAEQMARPENAKASEMELRYMLLDWEGIEHTHRQGKPILDYRPAYGYECAMCKAYIVAKDPGDAPFYGGPWNGRWAVTGGTPIWRVPIPVPIMLAMDDPMPSAATPIAEYRRGPDGAY